MRYRIHRIKDAPRENFRWAAHTGGLAIVKLRDYELGEEIESSSPYSAWAELKAAGSALQPGDLLEALTVDGQSAALQIAKYIGFEPAQWFISAQKFETSCENGKEFLQESTIILPTP